MAIGYKFSTGVPNITPAVYAADDIGGSDLNTEDTATDSNGVLSLDLDAGDYVAQWSWDGDTHQAAGDVVRRDADSYESEDVTVAAADVSYDNTTSELTATDVQAALDEIVARVVALETP